MVTWREKGYIDFTTPAIETVGLPQSNHFKRNTQSVHRRGVEPGIGQTLVELSRENLYFFSQIFSNFLLSMLAHRIPILPSDAYCRLFTWPIYAIGVLGTDYHGHWYESSEPGVKQPLYRKLRLAFVNRLEYRMWDMVSAVFHHFLQSCITIIQAS
jgi:hypothetical protein